MNSYITCLPINDNQGNGVRQAIGEAVVRLSGLCESLRTRSADGVWFNGNGERFAEPVIVVDILAVKPENDHLVREVLLAYKAAAGQEAVVLADANVIHHYDVDADAMAKEYGGATLFPSGVAVSFVDPVFL